MRIQGSRLRSVRLLGVIFLAFVVCAPATAALAAPTPTPNDVPLETLILDPPVPGFRSDPDDPFNGPLDLKELGELSGKDVSVLRGYNLDAYARRWSDDRGRLVFTLLFRLPSAVDAVSFMDGLGDELREDPRFRKFEIPDLPLFVGATMTEPGGETIGKTVGFRKGRFVVQMGFVWSEFTEDQAVTAAILQNAQIPGPVQADVGPFLKQNIRSDVVRVLALAMALAAAIGWGTIVLSRRRANVASPQVPGPDPKPVDSLRRRGRSVVTMLAITGVVSFAGAMSGVARAGFLTRLRDGSPVAVGAAKANDGVYEGLAIASLVLLIVTGIFWLRWQYLAQLNLRRIIGPADLRFSPGWSVGWWFVPLANLFMPFRAIRELSVKSSPAYMRGDREERAIPDPLIAPWWVAFASLSLLGVVIRGRGYESLDAILGNQYLHVIGDVILCVAAILAIFVVRGVQARQRSTWQAIASAEGRAHALVADAVLVAATSFGSSPVPPPALPPPLP